MHKPHVWNKVCNYLYLIVLSVTLELQQHNPYVLPDSKVHEANMGPTWVLSAPDGPYVGPMNLAMRVILAMYRDLIYRQLPHAPWFDIFDPEWTTIFHMYLWDMVTTCSCKSFLGGWTMISSWNKQLETFYCFDSLWLYTISFHMTLNILVIIGSGNDLVPVRFQAITETNADLMFIGPSGTNLSEISVEIILLDNAFGKCGLLPVTAKVLSEQMMTYC